MPPARTRRSDRDWSGYRTDSQGTDQDERTRHLSLGAGTAYVRKTKVLEAALPWLYLKGASSGEMSAALELLVGLDAKGLLANMVSRLKRRWAQEYQAWREAPPNKDRWVYVWADAVHSGLRAEQARLCALVVIGGECAG